MNACALSSSARRSSPTATNARPVARARGSTQRPQVGEVRHPQQAAGIDLERRSAARRTRPARCSRSHGTPPNCSACVVSCSATQRSSWSGSASSVFAACPRFGADEQQPGRRGRIEHRELVLAEHAAARGSRRSRPPRSPSSAPAAPPSGPSLRADAVGHRVEHAADRAQVGVDPLRPADGLGHRQRRRGGRARCRRRRAARSPPPGRPAARTARGRPRAAGRRSRAPPARPGSSRSPVPVAGSHPRHGGELAPDRPPSAPRRPASAAAGRAARPAGPRTR